MRQIPFKTFVAACLLSVGAVLSADEGMWMPQQIPDLAAQLKALGFAGDPKAFADLTGQPMGAIVSIPGCSASFVSSDGLIVTNHHCVVGSLQFNSTPAKNLLEEGFLAATRDEELSNGPGVRVLVTTEVKEITDEIAGRIDAKLTDRQRFDLIERRTKERTAACEKDGSRCRIASFFEGLRFFEIAQMEIQDVRLVYAPAAGIGVYGGETDNWQWPRHTGDFGFYRAYVSPEGKSVPFAKANVPYHPKHFLKISPNGASPGDLVFVAGYPGRTERHETFAEVKETTEWEFPRAIRRATDSLAILEEVSKGSKETEIKVAARKRGLGNGLTNRKGMLAGLVKGGILAKKEKQEKELAAWIAADAGRQKEFGDVLPAFAALQSESEKTRARDAAFAGAAGSALLASADTIYRLSLERPKKDLDRDPQFQERNWSRIKEAQERLQKSLDLKADRALFRYSLLEVAKLPEGQRIAAFDRVAGLKAAQSDADAGRALDVFLDRLYSGTKLSDKDVRLSLLQKSTAEILARKDSFIDLAVALAPLDLEIRERRKQREGARSRLRPRYMRTLLAKNGGLVAPDANSTLRVTFGRVEGVAAKDGLVYLPQTTLAGIADKNTGSGDFDAPKKELAAIEALRAGRKSPFVDAKLSSVPVNFLSSVDTTGGNSGSATLNAKGELCGLLFDGTFDTIASDYLFDPVKTRSIHVDSRYILWVMSDVDGAKNLLDELGIR